MAEPSMMMKNLLLAGAALVGLAVPVLAAETEVGSVFDKEYHDAKGIRISGIISDLNYRDTVYEQEKVTTGPGGRTALEFLDLTRIQIGANSTVVLDKYVYDPSRQVGEVGVNFGKGIFRFVTGGLKNKAGYDLRTPTATMVVRGTKVIIAVLPDGKSEFTFVEGTGQIIPCGGASRDAETGQTLITTPKCDGVSVGVRSSFDTAVEADTLSTASDQTGNNGSIRGTPASAGGNSPPSNAGGGGGDNGGGGDTGGGRGNTSGHQGGGFGNK
jgi:hypothetical protein